jgi:hypothetical protein
MRMAHVVSIGSESLCDLNAHYQQGYLYISNSKCCSQLQLLNFFLSRGDRTWNFWSEAGNLQTFFGKAFTILYYQSHSSTIFQETDWTDIWYSSKFGTFWVIHFNRLCCFSTSEVNMSIKAADAFKFLLQHSFMSMK